MKTLAFDVVQKVRKNVDIVLKLLPILSFIIPFLILYTHYPNTFEMTWKGRTYYLFFLWLFFLELILGWEEIQRAICKLKSIKTAAFIIALFLPTVYVIAANYYGLNRTIVDLALQNNVGYPWADLMRNNPWADLMPLSTEYLVFSALFALIIVLAYGINGSMNFSISVIFLGVIGLIYTIDNVYPYGRFAPFQFLVPTTATLAANVLNLMGYQTQWVGETLGTPILRASNFRGEAQFGIAWPCSGIDSLLIYSVTILLFLKKSAIPWKQQITYFAVGAAVTYFINVLRIVTIFVIGINNPGDVEAFHNYYGQLYSLVWIVSYPLIVIGTRASWGEIRNWKKRKAYKFSEQTKLSS